MLTLSPMHIYIKVKQLTIINFNKISCQQVNVSIENKMC